MRTLFNLKDGTLVDETVEEINMRRLCKSLNEKKFVLVNNVIVKYSEVVAIKVIHKEATIS